MRDTFEDCHALISSVAAQIQEYSLDIRKIVLLALLRDTLVEEANGNAGLLEQRAVQVADYIAMDGGNVH